MRLEEYRRVYDKISLSKEADERILQTLLENVQDSGKKRKGAKIRAVRIVAAAAVFVVAVGIMKFSAVASTTKALVSRFTNVVLVPDESAQEKMEKLLEDKNIEYGYPTSKYEYSDSGEYLEVNSDAPKKTCRMVSMDEVSQALGVDLLQSKDACETKNSILYTPYVSDSGALNGVIVRNDFYVLGDIQDVQFDVSGSLEIKDELEDGDCYISYREGEKYQSPIMTEITIRTSNAEGVDADNHELDYAGRSFDIEGEGCISEEIYEIKNLGVTAFLTEDRTPGPYTWNKLDGEEINSATDAFFVYQGVEYRYVGAVSLETMQEFLEGLEIPEQLEEMPKQN